MQITLDIPAERIANLFESAIESGDPVTTASRGGWCAGVYWRSKDSPLPPHSGFPWYSDPALWAGEFLVQVVEVDDESTGHETPHLLNPAKVAHGLAIMATKYGHLFEQITSDNIDAACADIFLQCCLFGEERYA